MKIDGSGKVGGNGEVTGKKQEKVTDGSFGSHLKEAMASKTDKAEAINAPFPIQQTQAVTATSTNPIEQKAVGQIESLLQDLDIYKNSLTNENIPKSRLREASDSLMKQNSELVSLMKMVDNPKLKEIISQTASVVLNENSRINA